MSMSPERGKPVAGKAMGSLEIGKVGNPSKPEANQPVQAPETCGAGDRAQFYQTTSSSTGIDMEQITQLRLRLLENGYTPLANRDKRCLLPRWSTLKVDQDLIQRWARRNKRFAATGVRVENGLAVLDFDIDDVIMDRIAEAVVAAIPELVDNGAPLPVRGGKGFKEAWFVRTDEPFGRLFSQAFIKPGETAEDGGHRVEVFGGAGARQMGCFGAHTVDDCGIVMREYSWRGVSLLDAPLRELPVLTKDRFGLICGIAEKILLTAGWQQMMLKNERSFVDRLYDLTPDMLFCCNDGVTRTLAQLRDDAHGHEQVRCSASWHDPTSDNRTRCICGIDQAGRLYIRDFNTGITHRESVSVSPELSERLRRLATQGLRK